MSNLNGILRGKRTLRNFEELKKRLTSAPLLQYPDPLKPYQLKTDASDLAIGAVLRILTSEGYKPVANKLRMLSKSKQIYPNSK